MGLKKLLEAHHYWRSGFAAMIRHFPFVSPKFSQAAICPLTVCVTCELSYQYVIIILRDQCRSLSH